MVIDFICEDYRLPLDDQKLWRIKALISSSLSVSAGPGEGQLRRQQLRPGDCSKCCTHWPGRSKDCVLVSRTHRIIQIGWPEFGQAAYPPPASGAELELRVNKLRARMEERKLTHLVVYGDREHFANLAYLTGFDPRLEEALLIFPLSGTPLLVVGNECAAYVGVSPLFNEGSLRRERFQPFSLLNQPRHQSRIIREIFAGEGIGETSAVGCVGWKYFSDHEQPDAPHAIEIPSYLVDTLR